MKLVYSFEHPYSVKPQISLTIGNFDGLHLGHQFILKTLNESLFEPVVLTFSNHPSSILKEQPFPLLSSLSHKLYLFKQYGVKKVILITFTKHISKCSPEDFLTDIFKYVEIKKMILGHDAVFGYQRKGNKEILMHLAHKYNFEVDYLDPVLIQGHLISSSLIRKLVSEGNLDQAAILLGRRFSIFNKVEKGSAQGRTIGFPTLNLNVQGLCLPPLGVYVVEVKYKDEYLPALANLGFAPTLKNLSHPILEIHVIEKKIDFDDQEVEVIFHKFLRAEKKFENSQQLKEQISEDLVQAKKQKL